MKLIIKRTLARPQVRHALISFGKVALDRFLDHAIMKLQEFETRLKGKVEVIDAEYEILEDDKKDVRNMSP